MHGQMSLSCESTDVIAQLTYFILLGQIKSSSCRQPALWVFGREWVNGMEWYLTMCLAMHASTYIDWLL